MDQGYFKLKRSFFSHWLWDQERVYSQGEAFLDLLQLAAFAPTKRLVKGKLIPLERGELIASLRFLSERWSWGKDKVSSFLKLLDADSMTRRETRQGESVLILCNYNKHAENIGGSSDSYQTHHQTGARQAPDSDPTNKKKDKKEKKPLAETPAIAWSTAGGWEGITEQDQADWRTAYPACDIQRQLAAMTQWLKANPSKSKKKLWRKFITNWLSRTQERGGDIQSNRPLGKTNHGITPV